mmetsp:Transcript_1292/g.4053  ORF Transcript_1292/g.4053 Transcript_1292/m.4053 type:complete len:220 (+) Transcript_1292:1622-2281(+)
MVVARENHGEVELAARAVVVGHVGVLQGQHHVAVAPTLELVLELAQSLPRTFDCRSAKGAGGLEVGVERRVVREHGHEAHAPRVGAVAAGHLHHVMVELALHGLVVSHVGVEPLALPRTHVLAHGAVVHVRLVVAPGEVVHRSLRQSLHHARALVHGREEVGREEVPREHRDDGACRTSAPHIRDERLEGRKVLQRVHIRHLDHRQPCLRGAHGSQHAL